MTASSQHLLIALCLSLLALPTSSIFSASRSKLTYGGGQARAARDAPSTLASINTTLVLDLPINEWTAVPTTLNSPGARTLSASGMITRSCGDVLLIHGGSTTQALQSLEFAALTDTWVLELSFMHWRELKPKTQPPPRGGGTMNALGSRFFLLFGANQSSPLNDVWLFDFQFIIDFCSGPASESDWIKVNTICIGEACEGSGPPARWAHSTAKISHSLFTFGGIRTPWSNGFTATFDLTDGHVWRLSENTTATPSSSSSSSASSVFVWERVPVVGGTGPGPRGGCQFVTFNNSLFLTGGFNITSDTLHDAWLLLVSDPDSAAVTASWVALTPLFGSVMPFFAFGAATLVEEKVVTYGGINCPGCAYDLGQLFPEANAQVFVWEINLSNSTVSVVEQGVFHFSPAPAGRVAPVVAALEETLLVFGGLNVFASYCLQDVWSIAIFGQKSAWTELATPMTPPASVFSGLTVVSVPQIAPDNVTVRDNINFLSFGGQGIEFPTSPSFWHFFINRQVWEEVTLFNLSTALMPAAQWGHTQVAMGDSVLTVFGGITPLPNGTTIVLADLFAFEPHYYGLFGSWVNLSRNTPSLSPWPPARAYHVAVAHGDFMYIHGGCISQLQVFLGPCNQTLNDLWVWQRSTNTWTSLTSGPALYVHAAVLLGDTIYVYGGLSSTLQAHGDLHVYNTQMNQWSLVEARSSNTGESPLGRAALQLVALGQAGFMLAGGATYVSSTLQSLTDTWIYYTQENRWYEVTTTGPSPAWGASVATLTGLGEFFVYGGSNDSFIPQNQFLALQVGCNQGDFSPNFSSVPCKPCDAGLFSITAGATACVGQCAYPFTTPFRGATSEHNCSICLDKFCNDHGSCSVSMTDGKRLPSCRCTGWYRLGDTNNCKTPVLAIVIACTMSFVALSLIVGALFLYMRSQRGRFESQYQLSEKLLQSTSETLGRLERVWKIDPASLVIHQDELIGKGQFGEVFRGEYEDKDVAIKCLKDLWLRLDEDSTQLFEKEVAHLRTLRHKNIVFFYGAGLFDGKRPFIVVEFMANGSLDHLLHSPIELSPSRLLQFAIDCAGGIAFLHRQTPQLVHRDLKCANLLVSDKFVVKVADFGTAKLCGLTDSERRASLSVKTGSFGGNSGFGGTICWAAPEVLSGRPFTPPSDVYSFGIVMWEIAAREYPYMHLTSLTSMRDFVMRGGRPPLEPCTRLLPAYASLAESCWTVLPVHRPTMAQALARLTDMSKLVESEV
eukprot:m.72700 g.72700  ORF g.72700 m.72700 type:complete len:1239 (+) comp13000_c0_seq1:162-3878(+)